MPLGIGIEVTKEPGHTLVRVNGDVDMDTAPRLDEALASVEQGERTVVIDLTDVEFLDSSGLTVLVENWQRLRGTTGGAEVRLVVKGSAVSKVLDAAGLAQLFTIFDSYESAVAAP